MSKKNKVAIIGLGFRLPGNLRTLDELYQALMNKSSLIKPLSDDRFDTELFKTGFDAKGHSRTFNAGVVDDIYGFDGNAVKISKKEAQSMDPQQRLCLEMAIDALISANITSEQIKNTQTAVFIGAASPDIALSRADDFASYSPFSMTGTNLSIISNRLSHYFDIHGPSMTIDTACSSSMVALTEAVSYIRSNKDKMCLAGGVNVLLSPMGFVGFSQAHMLSPDGLCKVFDEDANGYVRAEGGAVLLLKDYDKAVADGDHIYASIVDAKVNQDGRTPGISLPSEKAQQTLLEDIYQDIDLTRLAYIEAHGTGTKVGDPIETSSIGHAVAQKIAHDYNRKLLVGSIKCNVGHLETASGMAGLLKAIAILENGVIPPNIHVKTLNKKIDFNNLGLTPVLEATELPDVNGLPLIGINSFGFGGTNAHVILEKAQDNKEEKAENNLAQKSEKHLEQSNTKECTLTPLMRISAACDEALLEEAKAISKIITKDNYLNVASTLFYCQEIFDKELFIKAPSFEELKANLDEFIKDPTAKHENLVQITKPRAYKKAMLVFSGNGSQYVKMGCELLSANPLFSSFIKDIDKELQKYQSWSVLEYLAKDKADWDLTDTEILQPILFAIELSLYKLLQAYGITCHGVCGHSVGEIAAACACNALTMSDGCRVIVSRSRNQAKTVNTGDMAVIKLNSKELNKLLSDAKYNKVQIAASNTLDSFTLSGDKEQLVALVDYCKKHLGIGAKLLNLNYPFHSSLMDPIKEGLESDLQGLEHKPLTIDFYSGVSDLVTKNETLGDNYWWHNIREEVHFYRAISHAIDNGFDCFIELGPRDILLNYVKDIARSKDTEVDTYAFTTKNHQKISSLLGTFIASTLFTNKEVLFNKDLIDRTIVFPPYPFIKVNTELASTTSCLGTFRYDYNETLGKKAPLTNNSFINEIDLSRNSYLKGHVVLGKTLTPAAFFLSMVTSAARSISKKMHIAALDDFMIMRGTVLNAEEITELKTTINEEHSELEIATRHFAAGESFEKTIKAQITEVSSMPLGINLPADVSDFKEIDVENFYQTALNFGINYQDYFCPITKILMRDDTLLITLKNDLIVNDANPVSLFALDGVLQALFAFIAQKSDVKQELMLPSLVRKIRMLITTKKATTLTALIKLKNINTYGALLDAYIFSNQEMLTSLEGVRYLKYAQSANVLEGLFKEELRAIPGKALCNMGKDDLTANIKSLTFNAETSDKDEINAFLLALAVNYIYSNIEVFDTPSHITSLFGDKLELDFEEGFAINALETLVYANIAQKTADEEYIVSSQFEAFNAAELFNTIVATDSSAFTQAELISRIGENLMGLINNTLSIEDCSGENRDSLLRSFVTLNKDHNTLLAAYAKNIADFASAKKVMHVAEIATHASSLLAALDDSLAKQHLFYTLITSEAEAPALRASYASMHNVAIYTFKEYVQDTQSFDFDMLIASDYLYREDELAIVNNAFIKAHDALKLGGIVSFISASLAPCTQFITSMLSLSNNFILNNEKTLQSEQKSEVRVGDFSIVSFNKDLPNPQYLPISDSAKGDDAITANNEFSNGSDKVDNADNLSSAPYSLAKECFEGDKYLAVTLSQSSALSDLMRTITFTDFASVVSDAHTDFALEKSLNARKLVFDFTNLSFNETQALSLFLETFAKGMLKLSRLSDIKVTVLVSDLHKYDDSVAPSLDRAKSNEINLDINSLAFANDSLAYALWCLVRTMRNELSMDILTIALNGSLISDNLDLLTATFTYSNEIICQKDKRFAPDFVRYQEIKERDEAQGTALLGAQEFSTTSFATSGVNLPAVNHVLNFKKQGNLQSLSFMQEPIPVIKDNEVLVDVKATGLNYRDVMWALGILPAEALENGFSGQALGLECSGVVIAAGKDAHVPVGAKVVAFAKNCFAKFVVTRADSVALMPEGLSFAEAASIAVAYLTAYYSIIYQARALRGESILIHGGAGGVGLSAITIALNAGLEIYATAGTVQKRALLKRMGVKHIYDSRSLSFREEILRDTDNKGVDIVLNSLYKDGEKASIDLLKPFGRFIELGKRDFFENNALRLKCFKDNLTFFGVDVDELLVYRPEIAHKLLTEIMAKFASGEYTPLPRSEYSSSQVKLAFADMKASKHIGKIVVNYKDTDFTDIAGVDAASATNNNSSLGASKRDCLTNIEADDAYIITGGLGGLGSTIASFLAMQGAKCIYLLGRKAFNENIALKIATLAQSLNVDKGIFNYKSLDVTNDKDVDCFIKSLKDSDKKIAGFYHAAVELKDAYIMDLGAQDYAKLFKTKVLGASSFIAGFIKHDLKPMHIMLVSSITTLFGNEGQANYVFANACLEALAASLVTRGFNASSLLLGPIGDVGLLKGQDRLLSVFADRLGLKPLKAMDIAEAMHTKSAYNNVLSYCALATNSLSAIKALSEARFASLCSSYNITAQVHDKSLLDKLKAVSEDEAVGLLTKRIQTILAEQLGMDISKIAVNSPLSDLGIDSLSLMETVAVLEKELEIKAGLSGLAGNSTIKSLATFCVGRIKKPQSEKDIVLSTLERQHGTKLSDEVRDKVNNS